MKKSVRLTTEMRYLNNREQVTITELMAEFQISRSTVIRDLQEMEELGLPLTATPGHNGGYRVLRNQVLPAVTFTPTEVQALFVAFLATTNAQLPYLKNRQAISEKLLSIVSTSQKQDLLQLNQLLWFENTNPDNPNLLELADTAPAMLGELIRAVVSQPQIRIRYQKPTAVAPVDHEIYVFHLYNRQQRWYVECYDLTRQARRTFRVDRIHDLQSPQLPILTGEQAHQLWRADHHAPNIELVLRGTAITRFKRLHQPGSRLVFLDSFQQTAQFVDYVDDQGAGTTMYADWLMFLGAEIEIKHLPAGVWQAIEQKTAQWQSRIAIEKAQRSATD